MSAIPSSEKVVDLRPPTVAGLATPLTAVLDIAAPRRGITCGGEHVLGLELRSSCTATDYWIRGSDVVAIYEPDDPRHLRVTALWRCRHSPGIALWNLIASATTSRRESDASLAVVSSVAADSIAWGCGTTAGLQWMDSEPESVDCLLIRRPATAGGSVLLAVHPADSRGSLVRREGGRVHVACWLFSAAAEKGVLFRGRTLAAIGPTADDTIWAQRLWSEFVVEPPMLTA